jgi:predicted metal-binding membrane protein
VHAAESAPVGHPTISLMQRGQLILFASLALLTIGAWVLTVHQARTMDMPMGIVLRGASEPAAEPAVTDSMAGMDMTGSGDDSAPSSVQSTAALGMSGMNMSGWSWDSFTTFLVAWAVMMAAMMFPAVAPLLLLYHSMASRRSSTAAIAPTWVFAAGYLLVWTAAGAATWALVQIGVEMGNRLGSADRSTWAPIALGATLVVAGIYQFSPLKATCLRQCQSPVGFLMTRWRSGHRGAVRMGLVHGTYCLGCCWAIFAVLVAAGVMSLAWMLLLTLVIFAEKMLPGGRRVSIVTGGTLLMMGILVASNTIGMPWRV